MPKASKHAYYAVRKGRAPGIYLSWVDCAAQINGFVGAVYKKLSTAAEARAFIAAKSGVASTSVVIDAPPVPSTADEQDCDIVYCDGACKGNGQVGSVAGIGVWWDHGDPRNIAERCPGDQTNNRAELIAIVRILETTPPLKRRLLIKTDSRYSIQCVSSWIFKWMSNGFLTADGKPVKNRALIKYLAALIHARRTMYQTVEFKHVRGHVGIEGNEAADQLANLGTTKPVLPERDWEKLEEQVLQSLKSTKFKPAKIVDDEPKEYAGDTLGDGSIGTNIGSIKPSQRSSTSSSRSDKPTKCPPSTSSMPTVSALPAKVSPPRTIPAVAFAAVPSAKDTRVGGGNKLPAAGSFGSTSVAKSPPPKSVPFISPTTALGREELQAYASCLLDDHESTNVGEDGHI